MKIDKAANILFLLLFFTTGVFANCCSTPMTPSWFLGVNPETNAADGPLLVQWDPMTDPNYPAYKNLPDVAPRKIIAMPENIVKFTPLIDFSTSKTPAQWVSGADVEHLYTQWSSTDTFIYFGGSYSEGQVLAPAPGWIRAAHHNGVKILGSVFFSPYVYGGKEEIAWLNAMVTPNAQGTYDYADQLIKIAHAYHFDGYFINQEAIIGDETLNTKIAKFIYYLRKTAPDLQFNWYSLDWKPNATFLGTPTEPVASNIFLDFSVDVVQWVDYAKSVGYPTQSVQKGVNAAADYDLEWQMHHLVKAKTNQAGLSQYGVQHIALRGAQPAHWPNLATALERINLVWNGDSTNEGLNSGLEQHTAITQTPFRTDFNLGTGDQFFSKGQLVASTAWSNVELTSILPNLHNHPEAKLDVTDAYEGGSSLLVTMPANKALTSTLFFADLPVSTQDNFVLVSKRITGDNEEDDRVCVVYQDETTDCITVTTATNWTVKTLTLPKAGTITKIILQSTGNNDIDSVYRLGTIYIGPNLPLLGKIATTNITQQGKDAGGQHHTYLTWSAESNATYYDIYGVENENAIFLGRTYNTFFDVITAANQTPYLQYHVVANTQMMGLAQN